MNNCFFLFELFVKFDSSSFISAMMSPVVDLKTTTGNITLSNLTANNSITLKSTTGDIIAEINDDESNFTNSSNKKKQLFTSSETGTVNVNFQINN